MHISYIYIYIIHMYINAYIIHVYTYVEVSAMICGLFMIFFHGGNI